MNGKIVKNEQISTGHFLLKVKLPESFKAPMPGQFIMTREPGRIDPLLGRPFGVYGFEGSQDEVTVEILYKVVGKGTLLLSRLTEGDLIEVLGPYGRTFDIYPEAGKVVFVCGGIGVAPITYLASHYRRLADAKDVELICYYGASKAENLVGIEKDDVNASGTLFNSCREQIIIICGDNIGICCRSDIFEKALVVGREDGPVTNRIIVVLLLCIAHNDYFFLVEKICVGVFPGPKPVGNIAATASPA